MAEIETITGDLRAVAQLESGTFQHRDELSRDQIRDASLRTNGFYVADFPLYTAAGGKATLSLARHTAEHPNNLVLVHLFDKENSSYHQLIQTGNFLPDRDEAQAVLEAADTLQVELSGLRLSGDDAVYCFLSIRTRDGFIRDGDRYQRPNELEQTVLQRVGYTPDFLGVLHDSPHSKDETRLYVLNPDYVVREAGEGFVGRASWLYDFNNSSHFIAYGRSVNGHNRLRGVRRVEAARSADAPEDSSVPVSPEVSPEIKVPRMEDILRYATPFVDEVNRTEFENGLRKLYHI